MKYPVVLVEWDDAHASLDTLSPEEELGPYKTISVGFLISKTKAGVTLGYDVHPGKDHRTQGYAFIPSGMVTKITIIKKGAK